MLDVVESKNLVSSPCYEYTRVRKKFRVSSASHTNNPPHKALWKKSIRLNRIEMRTSPKIACSSEMKAFMTYRHISSSINSSFYNYYHSFVTCYTVVVLHSVYKKKVYHIFTFEKYKSGHKRG